MKIRWVIQQPRVGGSNHRRFQRDWPRAFYENGLPAATLACDDDYSNDIATSCKHAPLTMYVADHTKKPWDWRRVKERYPTLARAKAALLELLEEHSEMKPRQEDYEV